MALDKFNDIKVISYNHKQNQHKPRKQNPPTLKKKKRRGGRDLIVKRHTSVRTNALFTSAKSPEILCSFGYYIIEQFHYYPSFKHFSNAYIQITPLPPHHIPNISLFNPFFSFLSFSLSLCCYTVFMFNIYIYI